MTNTAENPPPLILGSGLDKLGKGRISTVPYLSKSFYEKEKDIWLKTWVMVGRESEFKKPGDYTTFNFKAVNKPIVIIRGKDDKLRAFYNVCLHRGGRLLGLEPQHFRGNVQQIACRSHCWRYQLDGRLVGLPEKQLFPDLEPREELRLKPVHLDTWGGFVFVNMAEEPEWSLAEYLSGIPEGFRRHCAEHPWTWYTGFQIQIACNWKDALNIQHEAYHASFVHPDTLAVRLTAAMCPSTVFPDSPGMSSIMATSLPPEAITKEPTAIQILAQQYSGADRDKVLTAFPGAMNHANDEYFGIEALTFFPNFMIDNQVEVLMTMRVWPLSHDKAEVEWDFFHLGEPENFGQLFSREQNAIATRDVLTEDWYVMEQTYTSLNSGILNGVHIGNDMEATVRAFHEKLLQHLDLTEEDLINDYA